MQALHPPCCCHRGCSSKCFVCPLGVAPCTATPWFLSSEQQTHHLADDSSEEGFQFLRNLSCTSSGPAPWRCARPAACRFYLGALLVSGEAWGRGGASPSCTAFGFMGSTLTAGDGLSHDILQHDLNLGFLQGCFCSWRTPGVQGPQPRFLLLLYWLVLHQITLKLPVHEDQ